MCLYYSQEIKKSTQDEKAEEMERLKRELIALNEEEARLGRLFMEGKISEGVYDQLRGEWQAKPAPFGQRLKN